MMPNGRRFSALISRLSEPVEIYERREGETTDTFNNPTSNWELVETVSCAVVKPEDTFKTRTAGGERQTSATSLFFQRGIDLPDNFRVKQISTGKMFEVENQTDRRSHIETNAIEVTE